MLNKPESLKRKPNLSKRKFSILRMMRRRQRLSQLPRLLLSLKRRRLMLLRLLIMNSKEHLKPLPERQRRKRPSLKKQGLLLKGKPLKLRRLN